jgi:hypothetical protein
LGRRLSAPSGSDGGAVEDDDDYGFSIGAPPMHVILPELRKHAEAELARLCGGKVLHGTLIESKFKSFMAECDNLEKFLKDHGYAK